MSGNYIKLYSNDARSDSAYFLNEGSVYFYLSNVDKYVITGKNLIIGATEIIMNNLLEIFTDRIETAVASRESRIKKMPVEKFLEGLHSYSFSLNVSMVLAKQVLLTNRIINTNLESLAGDERKTREVSIKYFTIIDRLKEEYEKRKLPWLKSLVKEFETNLTYKRGEAYFRSSEPTKISTSVQISDKDTEYPRGSIICEQDSYGEEMYILKSGSIHVILNGNKVATIDEQGTVIGEMALLLGEKRSATLKAGNNVVITRIKKKDLREISEKQSDFISNIAQTLAKKHYFNVVKIGDINKSLIEQSLSAENEGEKKPPQSLRAQKELKQLMDSVEKAHREKDAEYLDDLVNIF